MFHVVTHTHTHTHTLSLSLSLSPSHTHTHTHAQPHPPTHPPRLSYQQTWLEDSCPVLHGARLGRKQLSFTNNPKKDVLGIDIRLLVDEIRSQAWRSGYRPEITCRPEVWRNCKKYVSFAWHGPFCIGQKIVGSCKRKPPQQAHI